MVQQRYCSQIDGLSAEVEGGKVQAAGMIHYLQRP